MRTIVAITTPLIKCPIHVIRMSGPNTFDIINKVIKKPLRIEPNSIQYNHIIHDGSIVDEVLLNVFVHPHSFTGEDVIEINCHGNPIVSKQILDLLVINGAEYANPGEYSMQALINNKMNYYEIEAMNNLIMANNNIATKFATNALVGNDNKKIEELKHKIFMITGSIEVNIDYPEYDDVPEYNHQEILDLFIPIKNELELIYNNSKIMQPIFNGLKLAIVGKPNVGKSSLLNFLSKKEKAIVSNIEGTTRDIVESNINFDGINITLLDTAGIRTSSDTIEQAGINKSFNAINEADIIVWLLDNTETDEDKQKIYEKIKDKRYIEVYNKSDINNYDNKISISVINNDVDQLINALKTEIKQIDYNNMNNIILQSDRQINILKKIINLSNDIVDSLKSNQPLDLIQSDFETIINSLNEILGKQFEYDKLDELFKHFCLGK